MQLKNEQTLVKRCQLPSRLTFTTDLTELVKRNTHVLLDSDIFCFNYYPVVSVEVSNLEICLYS